MGFATRHDIVEALKLNADHMVKTYGVQSMSLFGSVARGENTANSDVDIFVEMPPKFVMMYGLEQFLKSVLKTPIDLVRRHSAMSATFLNQISRDGIRII